MWSLYLRRLYGLVHGIVGVMTADPRLRCEEQWASANGAVVKNS